MNVPLIVVNIVSVSSSTSAFLLHIVGFPSLGPLLQWTLANYTVLGDSVDYLSQTALKIVEARRNSSNESVVSLRYSIA